MIRIANLVPFPMIQKRSVFSLWNGLSKWGLTAVRPRSYLKWLLTSSLVTLLPVLIRKTKDSLMTMNHRSRSQLMWIQGHSIYSFKSTYRASSTKLRWAKFWIRDLQQKRWRTCRRSRSHIYFKRTSSRKHNSSRMLFKCSRRWRRLQGKWEGLDLITSHALNF